MLATSTPVLHAREAPAAPRSRTPDFLVGIHVGGMIDVFTEAGVGFGVPAAARSLASIVRRIAPLKPSHVVIGGSGELTDLIARALVDAGVSVTMRGELPPHCVAKPWVQTRPGDRAALVLGDYLTASAANCGARPADTDGPVRSAAAGQPTSSPGETSVETATKSDSRAFDIRWFLAITAIQFVPFFLIAWWMSASAGSAFWWAGALAPLSSINLELIGRGWPSLFDVLGFMRDILEVFS